MTDFQEAVDAAVELMNKYHAALDTISNALWLLNRRQVRAAQRTLQDFQIQYDPELG